MYDLIVIGGGPAGYVGAVRASELGAKVALVERAELAELALIGAVFLQRRCSKVHRSITTARTQRRMEWLSKARSRPI